MRLNWLDFPARVKMIPSILNLLEKIKKILLMFAQFLTV
jgi:hypothetical protein